MENNTENTTEEFAEEIKEEVTENKSKAKKLVKQNRIKMLKRRRRNFVLCVLGVIALLVLVVMAAIGTFNKKASVTTLTVKSNGQIVFEEVYELEEDASISDVKEYAKSLISEYNSNNGTSSIKFKKCAKNNGKVYLKTIYKDADTYADFTGHTLFTGTIKAAEDKGYDFDATFVSVESGKKADTVEADKALKDTSLNVVISDQKVKLVLPSDIEYVSDSSTKVSKKNVTVSKAVMTYVIY